MNTDRMLPGHVLRSLAIALTFLVAAIGTTVQSQAPPGADALIIGNVTLIDGTGRPPRANIDVLIERGKISRIGTGLEAPPAADRIDGTGKFAMPGLIDAHAHLDTPMVFQVTAEERAQIVAHTPLAFLYNGVTTVIDLSSPPEWIFAQRAAQRDGRLLAPRIFSCGRSFTPVGGWGSRHGGALADAAAARAHGESLIAGRADCFKVMIEDGLGRSGTYKEMPDDILQAISAQAHAAGMPMFVHAINIEEYRRAIGIRPRAIVHGLEDPIPAGDPLIADLKAANIAVVPTISLFEAFNRFDGQPGALDDPVLVGSVPAFLLANLRRPDYRDVERQKFRDVARMDANAWARKAVPIFMANTKAMHAAGITIGVGTDAGGPVGYDFQGYNTPREVELLVESGLTPMDAIVAATRNGATIAGAADRIGTIEPGKEADILLLTASPIDRIDNIRRIDTVILAGRVYPRARFAATPRDR